MSRVAARLLALAGGTLVLASAACAQNQGFGAAHSYPPTFGRRSSSGNRPRVGVFPNVFGRRGARGAVREIADRSRSGYEGNALRYRRLVPDPRQYGFYPRPWLDDGAYPVRLSYGLDDGFGHLHDDRFGGFYHDPLRPSEGYHEGYGLGHFHLP